MNTPGIQKVVKILAGAPGSGKTTWAREHRAGLILSANEYFTAPDGSYNYLPSELGAAHRRCMRQYVDEMTVDKKYDLVFIDNTNTRDSEITPYARVAQALGAHVEVHAFLSHHANVHGVPDAKVVQMALTLNETLTRLTRRNVSDARDLAVFKCPILDLNIYIHR